jgi:hypothetical protein
VEWPTCAPLRARLSHCGANYGFNSGCLAVRYFAGNYSAPPAGDSRHDVRFGDRHDVGLRAVTFVLIVRNAPGEYLAARGVSYPCNAQNFGHGDLAFASLSRTDEQYALRPLCESPQSLFGAYKNFCAGRFRLDCPEVLRSYPGGPNLLPILD